jgi:hypothetical protein
MDGGPGVLAEVVFRSLAECGRWYPPRPPWGDPHAYLTLACVEGAAPVLVRFVDGPRVAPGEPGRFVLAPVVFAPDWDAVALQPGVEFRLLDPGFNAFIGRGRVLELLDRTPVPPDDPGPSVEPRPDGWYGPPARVRIARGEGRFPNVGRLADGTQFVAYAVTAYPTDYKFRESDWMEVKRVQAVAHYFDPDGRHLRTDVRVGGVEADDGADRKAFGHLNAIHDELVAVCGGADPEYGDIWVQLFSADVDGIRYALRYERHEHEDPAEAEEAGRPGYESVVFDPRDIVFHPPWNDGIYDT